MSIMTPDVRRLIGVDWGGMADEVMPTPNPLDIRIDRPASCTTSAQARPASKPSAGDGATAAQDGIAHGASDWPGRGNDGERNDGESGEIPTRAIAAATAGSLALSRTSPDGCGVISLMAWCWQSSNLKGSRKTFRGRGTRM